MSEPLSVTEIMPGKMIKAICINRWRRVQRICTAAQQPSAFGGPQQGTGFGGGFGGFGASAGSPAPAKPAAQSNSAMWAMRR